MIADLLALDENRMALVVVAIAFVSACLTFLLAVVAVQNRIARQTEIEMACRDRWLERGHGAEEIERVLRARVRA